MLNRIINSIAGSYNERQIKTLLPLTAQINALCDEYDSLTEEEIKAKSAALRDKISLLELPKKIKDKNGNRVLESTDSPLDAYLPEAFALVKQACKRLVGTTYLVK